MMHEGVHQRAGREQEKRQQAQHVRRVFGQQIESRDNQKFA
jgi:hypothetical protein